MLKKIFKLLALTIFFGSLGIGWYWNEYKTFLQAPIFPNNDTLKEQVFTINRGDTIKGIASHLKQQNIIEHPRYFELYTRLSKQSQDIKAGEYTLKKEMTIVEVVDVFVKGKVNQYALTLVEGTTLKEALEKIANAPNLVKTLDNKASNLHKLLGSEHENLEGLLYPDTYLFPRGTTDIQFIERAYRRLQSILAEEWKNREKDLPLKTPYEALILASIVEKESGMTSERDKIAGVFIRRLNKKMRLQSDPTIIYGMGERYDGNIRKRDINEKTAYNTYQIDRLPPTPIALVGRSAIHAVLHPDNSKSLYFVADGSGGHHFSNTLKEHNRAVRKYILKK
jgi:UPF0755 protein